MEQVLTIGQLAKATGVAAKTIRYYEDVGVLPPAKRTAAGYRQYDRRGVQRLLFIRRARSLGLPLQHLKALTATLDGGPRPLLRSRLLSLVREQLSAVQQQVAELHLALWLGGGLSDRWGRTRVLVPGLLGYAVLLGGVTFLTQPFALACWGLATGVVTGLVAPLPAALVGDRVLPPLRGVAIGWLRTMTDSGHIVGALVMGVLADAVNLSAPFLTAAILLTMMGWQCWRNPGGHAG